MLYNIVYKKYSEISNALVLVSEDFEAEDFYVNDAGVLTLIGDINLKAIPPGLWLSCEVAAAPASSIVAG